MDTTWRPNVEICPNCPRCGSSNTKFCYYNNYSLTQPRYFCKGCRRYWTKGGSLRNVPIGGGCRKSRRGKPWRLPTDYHHHGVISSKTHHHDYDSVLGRYPGCATARVTMMTDSNQLMPAADGSHIDLALVYANYLNPPPDNPTEPGGAGSYRIPELGNELLIGANTTTTTSNNYLLQDAKGTTAAVLSSGNYNNVDDDQVAPVEEYTDDPRVNDDGYVLPPLPGEDSIFWASLDLGGDDLQLQDPYDLSFANIWSMSTLELSRTDHATNFSSTGSSL